MDYNQTKKEIEKKAQAGDKLGAALVALKYIRERGLDNGATLFAVGGIADHALREITHTGGEL